METTPKWNLSRDLLLGGQRAPTLKESVNSLRDIRRLCLEEWIQSISCMKSISIFNLHSICMGMYRVCLMVVWVHLRSIYIIVIIYCSCSEHANLSISLLSVDANGEVVGHMSLFDSPQSIKDQDNDWTTWLQDNYNFTKASVSLYFNRYNYTTQCLLLTISTVPSACEQFVLEFVCF